MSTTSNGDPFQISVYVGINIENILYGINLLLYFKTMRILLANREARKRSDIFYALFSTVMMFSITVWIITQAMFGEEMWLLQSNYPGGADAYWQQNIAVWYMDWGTTVVVILQLMTDALMIYRCRIIWNSYYVVILPCILWLATLVLGFLVDWVTSSPGGNFFSGIATKLGLAYYTVSVFLNTTLTCQICYRMVRHALSVQRCLGKEYASSYFDVVVIIVESVLPYTLTGIAFLVSFGLGSPTSVAFVCVYFMMMSISPQMLILRVVVGRAWDKDTFKQPSSTLKFSPGVTTGSQLFNSTGEGVLMKTSKVYHSDGQSKV